MISRVNERFWDKVNGIQMKIKGDGLQRTDSGLLVEKLPRYKHFTSHTTLFVNDSIKAVIKRVSSIIEEMEGTFEKITESIY